MIRLEKIKYKNRFLNPINPLINWIPIRKKLRCKKPDHHHLLQVMSIVGGYDMRLWSIHPKYLDSKGLVALWREGLLAQSVLLGNTRGYQNHPQLIRFKNTGHPSAAIACYLRSITDEADNRSYNFDKNKIVDLVFKGSIPVTSGQIQYEFEHLLKKLETRDQDLYQKLKGLKEIEPHPLFNVVTGNTEHWEIRKSKA